MSFDPVAALRPFQVDIQLGEFTYTIPEHPASTWITAAIEKDGLAIVPGLLGDDDRCDVLHEWLLGNLDGEEIAEAARAAVGAAAGRDWWEAVRLIVSATGREQWPVISGSLVRSGVDMDKISLAAFCNAVYALAVSNASETDRQRLDADLSLPPPGVDIEELFDEEEETAQFEADLADFGGA
jgi:hypothetical protein